MIKACHFTGVGVLIPEEISNPARELCQGLLNQLVIYSGFEDKVIELIKNISDETITKVFAGMVSSGSILGFGLMGVTIIFTWSGEKTGSFIQYNDDVTDTI